jgi:glycine betaine/proline transport system permease protein
MDVNQLTLHVGYHSFGRTHDLGQEVYIALTKADIERGIVAGLAIAFIAIILDRIISASARNARIRYGLE